LSEGRYTPFPLLAGFELDQLMRINYSGSDIFLRSHSCSVNRSNCHQLVRFFWWMSTSSHE